MIKSVIFMYLKTKEMEGIRYLTDDQNKKRFVQIDIDKYGGEYLQDLIDGLIAESRKREESVPLEEVVSGLRKAATSYID
jgi:uncharacterized protein YehS (DUF1456 family)